jgi:hypothetical protein
LQAGDAASDDQRIRHKPRVDMGIHHSPPCVAGSARG